MCTNAIQVPVKYRKTLIGVVLWSSAFFRIAASFNDYDYTFTEVRYGILQRREAAYLVLNWMLLTNTESKSSVFF